MLLRATLFAAALVLVLPAQNAWAWGSSGHRMIGEVAMRNLPAEVPAFLVRPDTIARIGELSREPDRSRDSGTPHDADLNPAHFVDMGDDMTVAGAIPLAALPATREDYDTALRSHGSDEYKVGYLPYAIMEGYQQLVKDFAYWRVDVAAQRAAAPADKAWLKRDQATREMLIVRDLGYWAHFVGDASQPMHVSIHYDGWGNFPNPQGYPAQKGLHFQFEGPFVRANVREADMQALMPALMPSNGTIQEWVSTYLHTTATQVVPLYELARVHPFDGSDAAEKSFVVRRLVAGAATLRDMVALAWRQSEDGRIGFSPPLTVRDIEAHGLPSLNILRGDD